MDGRILVCLVHPRVFVSTGQVKEKKSKEKEKEIGSERQARDVPLNNNGRATF